MAGTGAEDVIDLLAALLPAAEVDEAAAAVRRGSDNRVGRLKLAVDEIRARARVSVDVLVLVLVQEVGVDKEVVPEILDVSPATVEQSLERAAEAARELEVETEMPPIVIDDLSGGGDIHRRQVEEMSKGMTRGLSRPSGRWTVLVVAIVLIVVAVVVVLLLA